MQPHCSFRKWRQCSVSPVSNGELIHPPSQHHGQRQSSSGAQNSVHCRDRATQRLLLSSVPYLCSPSPLIQTLFTFSVSLSSLCADQFSCTAACSQLNSTVGSGMLHSNISPSIHMLLLLPCQTGVLPVHNVLKIHTAHTFAGGKVRVLPLSV